MVFKLVRTDTAEPCKIQLPIGKNVIGRGKLLECEDKRVSRNHGELEVVGEKVVIKALHQNPCFILKKGTTETQILKQNSTSEICNGDKFGLLPDCYWYELLHCIGIDSDPDVKQNTTYTSTDATKKENNEDANSESTEPMSNDRIVDSEVMNNTIDNNVDNIPDSPSLLGPNEEEVTQENFSGQNEPEIDTKAPESPPKRCHSPEEDSNDVKKIKTEPEIKPDPDGVQAGPSSDQAGSNIDDKKDQKPQAPTNSVLRERCMYGASCYRKNPQHKLQFSHPSDADWGEGARAPCPYGAACRRPDPRHWRDHDHPPGLARPQPQPYHPPQPAPDHAGNKKRKPKPKKHESSDENDDDDTPSTGLIVQGKRARKTITLVDAFSGSDSEEKDPYATDESDEWQPSGDMTDSQLYTQDI